jgi:hypothetical protein
MEFKLFEHGDELMSFPNIISSLTQLCGSVPENWNVGKWIININNGIVNGIVQLIEYNNDIHMIPCSRNQYKFEIIKFAIENIKSKSIILYSPKNEKHLYQSLFKLTPIIIENRNILISNNKKEEKKQSSGGRNWLLSLGAVSLGALAALNPLSSSVVLEKQPEQPIIKQQDWWQDSRYFAKAHQGIKQKQNLWQVFNVSPDNLSNLDSKARSLESELSGSNCLNGEKAEIQGGDCGDRAMAEFFYGERTLKKNPEGYKKICPTKDSNTQECQQASFPDRGQTFDENLRHKMVWDDWYK